MSRKRKAIGLRHGGNGNGRHRRRDELIAAVLPDIRVMAARIYKTLGPSNILDRDDLVQEAALGLLEWRRLTAHDPKKARLQTFVNKRVCGAFYDGLRKVDWIKRGTRARMKREAVDPEVFVSLDQSFIFDGAEVFSLPDGQAADPARAAIESDLRETVAGLVGQLPESQRHVISENIYGGKSLERIGRNMGRSESLMSQVRSKGFKKLKPKLVNRGIA